MKTIKVIFDDNSAFIMDIVDLFSEYAFIESYYIEDYRDKKKARPIQTRHGTLNLPLIVFEDENLIEVDAIWPETNPDWLTEIDKKLIKLNG